MFAHAHPQCSTSTMYACPGHEPRHRSSKSSNHFLQSENVIDIMDAIFTAAAAKNSLTEPWISTHLIKPNFKKCNKNTQKSQLVSTTNNTFEIKLDITNFSPEEINVKVMDNSIVVIEAKHEEKTDNYGFISRQFVRRFVIPEGVIVEKMNCTMTSANTILISAPRHIEKQSPNERSIPINIIGHFEPSSPSSEELKNVSSLSKVSSSELNLD